MLVGWLTSSATMRFGLETSLARAASCSMACS